LPLELQAHVHILDDHVGDFVLAAEAQWDPVSNDLITLQR
jgi:hypothetical protein